VSKPETLLLLAFEFGLNIINVSAILDAIIRLINMSNEKQKNYYLIRYIKQKETI